VILTDRFTCLNYPRTGSTFVRTVLRRVYGRDREGLAARLSSCWGRRRFRELALPIDRTASARRAGRKSQHGAVHQIPRRHRALPIVSVLRHPLDRAVSQYEHGFWRTNPPGDLDAIRARFAGFPDIDFGDYLELQRTFGRADVLQGGQIDEDIGPDTLHFVRFFAPDPERALSRLTSATVDSGAALEDLADVRFLRFERLTEDLLEYLLEVGFSERSLDFVGQLPRINAADSRRGRTWRDYFTPELEAAYRSRERLLFRLAEELDG
jgi:hypothetical protein